jgi:hypothetical protein
VSRQLELAPEMSREVDSGDREDADLGELQWNVMHWQ